MAVLKILRAQEWAELEATGAFAGSAADRRDGFVHLSTPAQAPGTAVRHFAGEAGLWLVALDEGRLGAALRWEMSRGGEEFPHLYRAIRREDMLWARPLSPGEALGDTLGDALGDAVGDGLRIGLRVGVRVVP
jgi:uncharacterized protein (DUF952 family)